jgi:tetrahydromethanopterin S-methyltransferase subunit G
MTSSDDNLSLILRRLDEIERKLSQVLEELRAPTAIGYSARRGNLPRKD